MSLQIFVLNEVLTADEVGGIKGSDKSIEKSGKLSKIRKLFKFKNLHPKDTTEKRNFFTFDAKTDFKF